MNIPDEAKELVDSLYKYTNSDWSDQSVQMRFRNDLRGIIHELVHTYRLFPTASTELRMALGGVPLMLTDVVFDDFGNHEYVFTQMRG